MCRIADVYRLVSSKPHMLQRSSAFMSFDEGKLCRGTVHLLACMAEHYYVPYLVMWRDGSTSSHMQADGTYKYEFDACGHYNPRVRH